MNKDTPVLQFTINDVLGVSSINIDKGFTKVVPLSFKGMVSFNKWIEDRLVLSHRRNIFSLLQSEGITKIEDILSCTNCISLLDSFWVREVNSNLSWNSVSPYKNPLNERISRFSYDGSIVNGKKITGSPDFSTGGSFPKCWKRVDGSIYLYKSGSNIAYNSGIKYISKDGLIDRESHMFKSHAYELKGLLSKVNTLDNEDTYFKVDKVANDYTILADGDGVRKLNIKVGADKIDTVSVG